MAHHGQIQIEQSIMDVVMENHDVVQVIMDEVQHSVQQQVHQQYDHIQLKIMYEIQQRVLQEQRVYM